MFQDARSLQPRTVELGPPQVFQAFTYDQVLPDRCAMDSTLTIIRPGTFNAVRVVTKNLLAIQRSGAGPEWIMGYLILPLATPLATPFAVAAGDKPHVSFDYRPGDELNALTSSLVVTHRTLDGSLSAAE